MNFIIAVSLFKLAGHKSDLNLKNMKAFALGVFFLLLGGALSVGAGCPCRKLSE